MLDKIFFVILLARKIFKYGITETALLKVLYEFEVFGLGTGEASNLIDYLRMDKEAKHVDAHFTRDYTTITWHY